MQAARNDTPPGFSAQALARFVGDALRRRADPEKARQMAAYMKTDMPFHGVQKPDLEPVLRAMKERFAPASQADYEEGVRALWQLPHREEKYAAIEFAIRHRQYIASPSLPLYEQLIREGAWWDLVDPVATMLAGRLLLLQRAITAAAMERWVRDDHMWLRRAALLAHLKHKTQTDTRQLFAYCVLLAGEKEFFIRKAIGWALREYAKTDPGAVRAFLQDHRTMLSALSLREASRHLA
ncbi:MAG TPA: DNA alkylation repair protein [Noviherbaspirillum sp.]|uniref:DNA alkylation repair protein n=1 Tax=Noviherbaspirillum sp. TaxID=1926288 RepID=UPI002D39CD5F|nr:DNA alkylation repair protein [Noviherbaspirillum sp.]HYD96609.1 DNA alkylation repair protein [Noviherbaspirillum sp.]